MMPNLAVAMDLHRRRFWVAGTSPAMTI